MRLTAFLPIMKLSHKSVFSVLFFNILFLSLGLFFIELFWGAWLNEPDSLNRLNIIKNRKIIYDISRLYKSSSASSVYVKDANGLRGAFYKSSDIDILTVGGSTTGQRYITEGSTWQDVIQRNFMSTGKHVVVANADIDCQSSFGHIKYFDWWFPNISGLRPKYSLFYIGLNYFFKEEGLGYDSLRDDNNSSFLRLLKERSSLYHLARTLYGIYQADFKQKIGHNSVDFNKVNWTAVPLQTSHDPLMNVRLKEYSARLSFLTDKMLAFHSISIFVTQPARKFRLNTGIIEGSNDIMIYNGAKVNGVDFFHMMKMLDAVTISVCNNNRAICIDMAGDTLWDDDVYFTISHT